MSNYYFFFFYEMIVTLLAVNIQKKEKEKQKRLNGFDDKMANISHLLLNLWCCMSCTWHHTHRGEFVPAMSDECGSDEQKSLSALSYIYTYIDIYIHNIVITMHSLDLSVWRETLTVDYLGSLRICQPITWLWFGCCIMTKCTERKRRHFTKLHFSWLKFKEYHLKVTLNQQHSSNMYFFHHGRSRLPSIVKLGAKKCH